jgi:hypothetical protein
MSCHGQPPAPTFVRALLQLHIASILALSLLAAAGCDGSTTPPPESRASALLAADVDGNIYTMNPDTGALTLLVETGLGSILSMAFDPIANSLYGFIDQSANGDCDQCLYKQLDDTGSGPQFIGVHRSDYPDGYTVNLWDLSVRGADGALYATDSDECPSIIEVDPTTAAGTDIVGYNCTIYAVGLSYEGSGLLYATKQSNVSDHLSLIDPALMEDAPLNDVSYIGFGSPPGVVQSLTVHPTSGLLVGLTDAGDLVHVDQCTSDVTYVATPNPAVISIERVGTAPLPYPPGVCDPNASEVFVDPYDQIAIDWRDYPAAESFSLYHLNTGETPGTIDPAVPASYDGKLTGLTGVSYTFTGEDMCQSYEFILAAVVGGVEVAFSEQFSGFTACP